ncbi:hypothetical protein [Clostridium tyrobutyricum]|uniref:hypothetical protein n=1 Tax=Clostridium tyrobutyricum TaxID=1519 RepID=UPI00073D4D0C|nr:hypothetical protein [Clostridium tyrobutyricum]
MKNKIIVLVISSVVLVGSISAVYAKGKNNINSNNSSTPVLNTQSVKSESDDNYNNMIKIMQNNGFNEAAKDMENRDYGAMNKFMSNLNDDDYEKMIDIMQSNGYGSMAKMMKSVSRNDMVEMHQSMMGR